MPWLRPTGGGLPYSAFWRQVSSFTANGTSDDVTAALAAVAQDTTERNTENGPGILTTGSTPGDATGTAVQNYRIQFRDSGTQLPINDGSGREVYGVLSYSAPTWTLSYYKTDGTSYSFTSFPLDFMFAEVFSLSGIPSSSHLLPEVFLNIVSGGGGGGGDVTGPAGATDEGIARYNGATGKVIQDSNVTIDNAGNMTLTGGTSISVDTINESTLNNGVVINGVRNYGASATNPAAPAPSDGDIYYNTALRMQMSYDGFRSKWLSVDSTPIYFGRNGATAPGQYYRGIDGRVLSGSIGFYAIRSGTIVAFGYTRSNALNCDFDIMSNGALATSVNSVAAAGRDVSLNTDFSFGDILAVMNKAGGNLTLDVQGWVQVKWRV